MYRHRTAIARISLFAIAAFTLYAGCGKEPQTSDDAKAGGAVMSVAPDSGGPGAPGVPASAGSQPGTTTAETSSTPPTGAGISTNEKAKEPYKILLVVKTLNNPFFKPMVAAFEQQAKAMGVQGEVEAAPQETDVDKQANLVQNASAQGFKAICITPADSKALVPVLKAAAAKGIVIINVDNRLDGPTVKASGLQLGAYVGADNVEGGRLAGEALIAALGGKGDVAVIEGIRGVDNAESRKRGFEEAVKGKLKIVDEQSASWMTEKAQSAMQNMLAAHPGIKGVFCANDEMAIGAIKAIKTAGKSGAIKVVSYDHIKEVQPYLNSGELSATIEQHPDQMGSQALRLAVLILDGKMKKGAEIMVSLEAVKK